MAIYFYKEFGPLGYLANYSNYGFYDKNIYYKTVEHYYQSQKFDDKVLKNKVINAKTPKEASIIGRDRNNKLKNNWKNIKQDVMLKGVLLKFRQNIDILVKLLNTGDEKIIENTVDEYYWGCGKNKTGENNFGKILVKARNVLKNEIKEKFENLKKYDEIYVLGHNNMDFDSYFSSFILSKILRELGINAKFAVLDYYSIGDTDKNIINDFKTDSPIILKNEEINKKYFILVDHNDTNQSLGQGSYNVLFAIDHHIDSKSIKKCYSVEYTSTLLFIYDIFKHIYKFNEEEKRIIALSVMTDSEYLVTSRFKENDKKLYDELNVSINPEKMRLKYFKTTDFHLRVDENIKNNYKFYNINNVNINRVNLKGYYKNRKYINDYLIELDKNYNNPLLIWNEYDTMKTLVYYNGCLTREYDFILTSSVLIIKDILNYK